jgi:hypothetical protein
MHTEMPHIAAKNNSERFSICFNCGDVRRNCRPGRTTPAAFMVRWAAARDPVNRWWEPPNIAAKWSAWCSFCRQAAGR